MLSGAFRGAQYGGWHSLGRFFGRLAVQRAQYTVAAALPLREYQQACIDECLRCIADGRRRIGVSLATGGGKTVIFANLLNALRQGHQGQRFRALVLVHRRELAQQATRTLKRCAPDLNVQVEMAAQRANLETADVVVASVLSLIRRLDQYPRGSIDAIIIDEAHHAAADSYLRVLEHLGAGTKDTTVPVIGFSATFERADRKALSRAMDEIVFHKGILEMIDEKWLCEGRFTTGDVDADLDAVAVSASDFQLSSLSQVMNTEQVNRIVLNTYLHKRREHKLKSALLFGVDVSHVRSLCMLFQAGGVEAQYVTAKTRPSERDSIVEDFRSGKIEVLMNCGIFTEGTDIPNIDCLLLCRPTRSRTLLIQMIGRGLRQHHSKDHCHVIDFVSACKVGVVSVPSLMGIDGHDTALDDATLDEIEKIRTKLEERQQMESLAAANKRDREEAYTRKMDQRARELMAGLDSMDLTLTSYEDFRTYYNSVARGETATLAHLSSSMRELKLLHQSTYPWVRLGKAAWAMSLLNGNHVRIYKKQEAARPVYELKLYRQLPFREEGGAKYAARTVHTSSDLVSTMSAFEALLRRLQPNESAATGKPVSFSRYAPWRQMAATDKQRAAIKQMLLRQCAKDPKVAEHVTEQHIGNYVAGVTKGEAANFMFAANLAPVYPVASLLNVLAHRATKL
ncbi:AaceriADR302Wp [[Ashbya] aceris (nom. inval.)]|nr:AaceriADR302Wp [[Ashbya] aceris (nom. inval.)]